jgi:type I restriction enzyme R subunit
MKDKFGKSECDKVKEASKSLLASLRELLAPQERWTEKEQTRAEVETFILDQLYVQLPAAVFTEEEKQLIANVVYRHVWHQPVSGVFAAAA